jgi:hypothetical protein
MADEQPKNKAAAKYAATVAKVTGNGAGNGMAEGGQPVGTIAEMFSTFDPNEMAALAQSGAYEFAPQNISLKPGQKITGILEGEGDGADFEDPVTKTIRHVRSFVIASPDGALRCSILSSVQLDKKLPPFMGSMVTIARNQDIQLAGGHRCADFFVWGPKREDGVKRNFVALKAPEQMALPAGSVIDVVDQTAPQAS